MNAVTVSPKFQVVISQAVREKIGLKLGQIKNLPGVKFIEKKPRA